MVRVFEILSLALTAPVCLYVVFSTPGPTVKAILEAWGTAMIILWMVIALIRKSGPQPLDSFDPYVLTSFGVTAMALAIRELRRGLGVLCVAISFFSLVFLGSAAAIFAAQPMAAILAISLGLAGAIVFGARADT